MPSVLVLGEGLLRCLPSCVGSAVGTEVGAVVEVFATLCALVGLLSSMGPLVDN